MYPVVIKDVLPVDYYLRLQDNLIDTWEFGNKSYASSKNFWMVSPHLATDLPFTSASTVIKLKIQKFLQQDLKLCRIHVNGQTSGQESNFHMDFDVDEIWTFVLFCGFTWDTSWGGEFVCLDKHNLQYKYVPFIPNTGVLIPSNWEHMGSSPNTNTDHLRKSVAFSYCNPRIHGWLMKQGLDIFMFS